MEHSVADRAVGDEARKLVHGVLDPPPAPRDGSLDRFVNGPADEPDEDEGREDDGRIDSDTQHARVHAEESAGIPPKELVVQRLHQLVPNEALVSPRECGDERGGEEGEERGDVDCSARRPCWYRQRR